MSESRFFTVQEICEAFGIHKRTLKRWIDRGLFPPPLRVGLRKRLWLRVDVDAAVQQAREQAAK